MQYWEIKENKMETIASKGSCGSRAHDLSAVGNDGVGDSDWGRIERRRAATVLGWGGELSSMVVTVT
jgi:hypothetical protein